MAPTDLITVRRGMCLRVFLADLTMNKKKSVTISDIANGSHDHITCRWLSKPDRSAATLASILEVARSGYVPNASHGPKRSESMIIA